MLFGAVGQCITMILLAVLGSVQGAGAQVVSAVLLFVFNSFFAIGWLGMTWLYVSCLLAGIYTKLTCRYAACRNRWVRNSRACQCTEHMYLVSFFRSCWVLTSCHIASNWIFNFVVVMVTGPSFNNISWGTYIGRA